MNVGGLKTNSWENIVCESKRDLYRGAGVRAKRLNENGRGQKSMVKNERKRVETGTNVEARGTPMQYT